MELRDAEWDSWTCPLGWPVQGIWPASQPNATINAVDVSKDQRLIATADDFGRVKLFNYPCAVAGAGYTEAAGHSSHVTNVRWNKDNSYLVTVGGKDRAIMQWTVPIDPDVLEMEETDEDIEAEGQVKDRPKHSTHTLLSYTPLLHSSHTLDPYTPLLHSSHTLLSYTPLIHSSHTLLSYTPLIHSSHTLLSYTPSIPPGSGKSTFVSQLRELSPTPGQWCRVCQDELKSSKRCRQMARAALLSGEHVIIDRTNVSRAQRQVSGLLIDSQ
jgi:hypothetical protein